MEAEKDYHKNFRKKKEQQSHLQHYTRLSCVIFISNNTYLAQKFFFCFIHQKPRYAVSQNFRIKMGLQCPLESYAHKIYINVIKVYCMQIVVRFHTLDQRQVYHENSSQNVVAVPPIQLHIFKLHHCYLLIIHSVVHKFLCNFSQQKQR